MQGKGRYDNRSLTLHDFQFYFPERFSTYANLQSSQNKTGFGSGRSQTIPQVLGITERNEAEGLVNGVGRNHRCWFQTQKP